MRLDVFLVQHKNIESRTKAQELITGGFVFLNQNEKKTPLLKSSFDVTAALAEFISIVDNEVLKFVSRAGLKLEGALRHLQLSVKGQVALDIGQSTGGFTDCLLQHEAGHVVGLDVGTDQLHPKIQGHSKVTIFENLNVKDVQTNPQFLKEVPEESIDLIVGDVSFISLTKVVQFLEPFLKQKGFFLFLVKPQYECGAEYLDKNGIVTDAQVYVRVQAEVSAHFEKVFQTKTEFFESVITGKDGNKEFFIYGQKLK